VAPLIGVLALQGAFQRHLDMLRRLGISGRLVRYADELRQCDGLIIPGGESTTMTRLLEREGLWEPVAEFLEKKPVFGTCAGAILLARTVKDPRVKPFGRIEMEAVRNAYGRQVDSFTTEIAIPKLQVESFPAVFIRAPKFLVLPEVEILAELKGEPVLVRQGSALAAAFHPELTHRLELHAYFVEMVTRTTTVELHES